MPKIEWPLHSYRDYLKKMAGYKRADELLGHKYMEGMSMGFQYALEALDIHIGPCKCGAPYCLDKIIVQEPVVSRLSYTEPNVKNIDMMLADQEEREKEDKDETRQ